MHLYVELWKARPAWQALPPRDRDAFISGIGPTIQRLIEAGVELVGFAFNDPQTTHRADYDYLAVWKMPTAALAQVFEEAVSGYGFHTYFEQVNARGAVVDPSEVLAAMNRVTGGRA